MPPRLGPQLPDSQSGNRAFTAAVFSRHARFAKASASSNTLDAEFDGPAFPTSWTIHGSIISRSATATGSLIPRWTETKRNGSTTRVTRTARFGNGGAEFSSTPCATSVAAKNCFTITNWKPTTTSRAPRKLKLKRLATVGQRIAAEHFSHHGEKVRGKEEKRERIAFALPDNR